MNDTTTKGHTIKMVSIPLAVLEQLVRQSREKSAHYTELGMVEMAEWSLGRASAFETLIDTFAQD